MDLGEETAVKNQIKVIMVLRLHHSKLSSDNISKVLSGNSYDVIILEPWIDEKGDFKGLIIKDYILFYNKIVGRIRSCFEYLTAAVLEGKYYGSKSLASGYFPIDSKAVI